MSRARWTNDRHLAPIASIMIINYLVDGDDDMMT